MRLKRPRPTSLDEVRITRKGDIAVIEYADSGIRGAMSGSVHSSRP